MVRRSYGWAVSAIVAVALACVCAPVASARDDSVTSFDGTNIVLSFFPAAGLQAGPEGADDPDRAGLVQRPRHRRERRLERTVRQRPASGRSGSAGYNVLTWDPRGFGESGGTVEVDSPEYEGRDVQALIDYVARQPEAQLDSAGDPRVGMSGASYGGGIQLVTAALDSRLDAIAPDIAWHSLRHQPLQGPVPEVGLGQRAVRARRRGLDHPGLPAGETGQPRPAHHQRLHVRASPTASSPTRTCSGSRRAGPGRSSTGSGSRRC